MEILDPEQALSLHSNPPNNFKADIFYFTL